jgi:glycosyltransferase involved in cell wall biosynthesis
MTPKLTLGIPTLDRAELLHRCIDSCLRQTVPVRIVVADQGGTEATAEVMDRYRDHPDVHHFVSRATCLWENWRAAAEYAIGLESTYFAWVQDDDVISRGYARRVIRPMDRWPEALMWMARLHNGMDEHMGAWFSGNGPWVPMHLLDGTPTLWDGAVIPPTMYMTSWSLSPAVAFRCGKAFDTAIYSMPSDADLFSERLMPAYMGAAGKFVADPVIAGYWIHHGDNESYKQHKDQDRQQQVLIDHLDPLLDRCDWRQIFGEWCRCMPAANVLMWCQAIEGLATRHKDELAKIMQGSLEGRCEMTQTAPDSGPAAPDPVVIFDEPAPGTTRGERGSAA